MIKKTIQKPENWQDFESLCKKLWGEIFEIPNKIKKNGRSGQAQHGVDVYGIPKGESKYIGIQCKGKDDYADKKLTKKEVDEEINKSKFFKPNLGTLIFATSANKDVKIEEYIRLKDIENDFEILLYCWEDIADLIEDNKDTYNWYVNDLMHKAKHDFQVLFNDFEESLILSPKLKKKVVQYTYIERTLEQRIEDAELVFKEIQNSLNSNKQFKFEMIPMPDIFGSSGYINESWVDFEIILENSGNKVIEDWCFNLTFTSGVYELDDESNGGLMIRISVINIDKNDPRYIDKTNKKITYTPTKKVVLVQKDNRCFIISVLVELNASEISFDWELIARDFNKTGQKKISINPIYEVINETREVLLKEDERSEIEIEYCRVKN